MTRWARMLVVTASVMGGTVVGGAPDLAQAALVTQLDFTNGAANWSGKPERIAGRLFDRGGSIVMGDYQSDIVEIVRGRKTYSLFTSGLWGAPAPSATIAGNAITVDLSSLFVGWRRGDEMRLWNIGGQATGLYDPQTSEFLLSWTHLFEGGKHDEKRRHWGDTSATFFLQGKVTVASAAVAIPATLVLYGSGLFSLGTWTWLRRRRMTAGAA